MRYFSSILTGHKTLSKTLMRALQTHQPTQFRVGRAADNEVFIARNSVSRYHARLTQLSPKSFLLEDLDSKHGTWVDDVRIARKVVDTGERIRFAEIDYALTSLLTSAQPSERPKQNPLDYTAEFAALKLVYEQYPLLRKNCQNREKLIRTGSIILSSVIGIGAIMTTGPGAVPLLQVLSGAGLSVLIPALSSTILSTEEKIELLDKEYKDYYRCPNPDCHDPFGNREWAQLVRQKSCPRCKAIWVK
ncbi:MAG: FHA domain-containing protein [Cytophagaceae bacterium]|nr:FHA domain-containing protein [Cytophagaceae bacterium]